MSHLGNLIAELAPRGVELKPLGQVGEFLRGNGLQKADLTDEGFPAIHYGQLHTYYGIWTKSTKSFTNPSLATRLRRAKPGDVVIATTSENDEAVAKATAWLGSEEVAVSGDAYIFRHNLDPRYVAYFFDSERFQEQKKRYISGTKVRRVSGDSLAKILIPVPPLEVQREIARVLDQFTELETKLESNLSHEIESRREQRTYHVKQIFDSVDRFSHVALQEVADFFNAKAHEKLVDPDGDIALLTSRFISTNGRLARFVQASDVLTPALKNDVALVMSDLPNGRALARTFFVDANGKYAANQRVCLLRSRDHSVVLPRFLFHVLNRNPKLLAYDNGSDQTHLKKAYIQEMEFGLPPLHVQRRVVALLDELESQVSELVDRQLPAEIAARRKQYEYYRDKLLTFEEAIA